MWKSLDRALPCELHLRLPMLVEERAEEKSATKIRAANSRNCARRVAYHSGDDRQSESPVNSKMLLRCVKLLVCY